MTNTAIIRTDAQDSIVAGANLGKALLEEFEGKCPHALILFASPVYEPEQLLESLHDACTPGALVGCSSAGEFTFHGTSSSSAVALGIRSDSIRFAVHRARSIASDVGRAAKQLATTFETGEDTEFPHRTVLLLMDVLAGYGEEFLSAFTEATTGSFQLFGGGAADDAAFEETFVFADREAFSDGAVALEIRSRRPVGIGVSHGWTPASPVSRVTKASGLKVIEIDDEPAIEVFEEFARERDRVLDRDAPLAFFLHHVLGIVADDGIKLRVPLRVEEDGSIVFATEVPEGSTVRIMATSDTSAAEAARVASRRAFMALQGEDPGAALFFDCAATRLRLGDDFGASVREVVESIGTSFCVGCNTYGQFARVEGQFSGFHNATAVVCALPT